MRTARQEGPGLFRVKEAAARCVFGPQGAGEAGCLWIPCPCPQCALKMAVISVCVVMVL